MVRGGGGAFRISFHPHCPCARFSHSAVSALLLAYLWVNRRRFYARSDPGSLRLSLLMIPVLGSAVFIYGFVGLNHRQNQYKWKRGTTPVSESFQSGILIRKPGIDPTTLGASRFLGSLQIAGWLARLYLMVLVLRPVILKKRQEASYGAVKRIFRAYSRHSLSAFAVQNDKHHLLPPNRNALIAYAVRGTVALAAGDPLASDEDLNRVCGRTSITANGTTGPPVFTKRPKNACRPTIRWAFVP